MNALVPRLMSLLSLSIVLFFAPAIYAASVTGYVVIKDTTKFIQRIGDARLYELRPATTESSRNLDRLSDNDFLQGQGEFREGVFLLQTVDFVGLFHLLGPWQSPQDQTLVTFETYNQVSIYNPRTSGYDHMNLFGYSVAPTSGMDWQIFVSGRRSVSIASLKLESDRLTLQFINLDTGNFEQPFVLVRKTP